MLMNQVPDSGSLKRSLPTRTGKASGTVSTDGAGVKRERIEKVLVSRREKPPQLLA